MKSLDSMSDSTIEDKEQVEKIKVTVQKNNAGQFEVKNKLSKKRKAEVNVNNSHKAEKKIKACSENLHPEDKNIICENAGCPLSSDHWCQYPPVIRQEGSLFTSGTILRGKSLVNGVPKYVPFNNSFLETLGCQFYFKSIGGVIEIFSFSKHKC